MLATISGHLTVELQFNAFTYTVLVYHLHHLPLRFAKSSIKKIKQDSCEKFYENQARLLQQKSCKSLINQARLLQKNHARVLKIKQDSCNKPCKSLIKSSKTLAKKIMQESKKLCKRCLKDSCMISDMNHARFLQDKYCICKKCLLHNLIISERNYSRNAKKCKKIMQEMSKNHARKIRA